jgi:hypothetical protein
MIGHPKRHPMSLPPRADLSTPRAVCVMVRLVLGNADRRASIECWTPAGNALARQPAPNADLTLVLRQASELSDEFGFHHSYEFLDEPDDVAAYVHSWAEKRAALNELRTQRARLQTEASVGLHRADGSRKTDIDRANATAMMVRLSGIRESLLRRGFAIDGDAVQAI